MKRVQYTVTGMGQFPVDMLRYDCAYPSRGNDVTELTSSVQGKGGRTGHKIRLTSHRKPTVDRWNSFGWYVEMLP